MIDNQALPIKADEAEELEAARVAAFLSDWQSRIETAKEHWEEIAFRRVRKNRLFHLGFQWSQTPNVIKKSLAADGYNDDKQTVNVIQRYVKQQTASLYGKDPRVVVRHKERMMLSAWDGSHDTMMQAQQTVMMGGQVDAMALPPEAQAFLQSKLMEAQEILGEIQEYRQYKRMARNYAKTCEKLLEHCYAEQPHNFKIKMKDMVRRTLVCGVSYVKQVYHKTTASTPQVLEEMDRLRQQLAAIQRIAGDVAEGDVDPENDAMGEEMQNRLNQLQTITEQVLFEGLLLTYPDTCSLIPDMETQNIRTWEGTSFIAEEFLLTSNQIQDTFNVDVRGKGVPYFAKDEATKKIDGFRAAAERAHRGERPSDTNTSLEEKPGTRYAVYEVWDKASGVVFTMCAGVKTYLKKPEAPSYAFENFWPYKALILNDPDGPDDVWPQSDVDLTRGMQMEINRAAQALTEHRNANRPGWVILKGAIPEEDKAAVLMMKAHGVAEINLPADGSVDINKVIQRKPTYPLDQTLVETNTTWQNFLRVVGTQEAEVGGLSGASATETAIAQGARTVANAADTDALDEFLNELHADGLQLLQANMPREYVQKVVGPTAVWSELKREDVLREFFAEVESGSTGKPNQAQEVQNIQALAPMLMQTPGITPEFLGRELVRRMDDRLDFSEAYAAGMPSIQAMNGAASAPTQGPAPTSDPKANAGPQGPGGGPEAQGDQGANNAPNPQPPRVNAAPNTSAGIPNYGGMAQV